MSITVSLIKLTLPTVKSQLLESVSIHFSVILYYNCGVKHGKTQHLFERNICGWSPLIWYLAFETSGRSASCWNVLVDGAAQNKKKTKNEVVPWLKFSIIHGMFKKRKMLTCFSGIYGCHNDLPRWRLLEKIHGIRSSLARYPHLCAMCHVNYGVYHIGGWSSILS